jgi:predicted outer membrane protein
MKKQFIYCLLILVVAGCNPQGDRNTNIQKTDERGRPVYPGGPRNETMESNADGDAAAFMYDAALMIKIQMELATAAFHNSQNIKVKRYALTVIQDCKEIQRELNSIATTVGILLPEQYPVDVQEKLAWIKTLKGQDFDREYIRELRIGNPKMVVAFESGTDVITDDVKYFAEQTLPLIKRRADPGQLPGS